MGLFTLNKRWLQGTKEQPASAYGQPIGDQDNRISLFTKIHGKIMDIGWNRNLRLDIQKNVRSAGN